MNYFFCRKAAMLLVLCSSVASLSLHAQERIKVLSYNLLNYPNADYVDMRADTLAKILTYYTPDIFLMQELRHPRGVDSLLAKAFNPGGGEQYASGTWRWQVSAPWSSYKLQQNVIYNTEKLTLVHETFVQTGTRDHNVFKFMVNDPLIETHMDTTFLYTITNHLKASQGAANVAERLQMAQLLTGYLETLEPEAFVILGGDFNVYTSTEPAYQQFISGQNSSFVFADPIDTPGNWNSNSSFAAIHTQSTRTFQINGDGAGGGLDDRFDFVLVSENMMDPAARIAYVEDSYETVGNSGNCFNQNLLACTGGPVSASVRRALYQMSDHLPVKLELDVMLPFTSHTAGVNGMEGIRGANLVRDYLDLSLPAVAVQGSTYKVVNMLGNTLISEQVAGHGYLRANISSLPAGWYILQFPDLPLKPFRFVKVN